MRIRMLVLLVLTSLIISVVDFFGSQLVFQRAFVSYAVQSERDQVHDWAMLLGLLYIDHGDSWSFLQPAYKSGNDRKTILPTDGLLYTSVWFKVVADGRVVYSHQPVSRHPGSWEWAPITVQGQKVGELKVQSFTSVRLQTLQSHIEFSSMKLLSFILLVVVLASIAVSAYFLRRFLRPLEQLSIAVRNIRYNENTIALPSATDHEVREVANAIEVVRADLAKARGAREKLLADLHHELRTPMTIIANRLEAIQCGVYPLDEQSVTVLYDETMRMGKLLTDLRQLNDAQAGELRLELETVDVFPWITGMVELFRVELETRNVRIETSVSPHALQVQMDSQRMTQALINLLLNAMHVIADGSCITLSAHLDGQECEVTFTVCDEGPGISDEDLPHILERFYRTDVSRQRVTGGTGLGLAIVAEITYAHGGRVDIQSEVNRGTCVSITIPHFQSMTTNPAMRS